MVPKEFEECVRKGGRVRTVTLPDGRYMRVCYLNGKSYKGEVKRKKKK
jgi:hypothetical protein